MGKKKRNSIIEEILNSITPEEQTKLDAMFKAHIKWMDEHPDYNERYGTNKSYWLEEIKAKGFNPVGITIMTCEETIIMATQEEKDKAWELFKPTGWWYTVDEWEETRNWYVKEIYEGMEEDAPKVYCLDEKYKEIIK